MTIKLVLFSFVVLLVTALLISMLLAYCGISILCCCETVLLCLSFYFFFIFFFVGDVDQIGPCFLV